MSVVGVVGGGQLARMMIPAAINLGIQLKVFGETDLASAHLAVTQVGDYADFSQLARFAQGVDVLTFDHEHVPLEHLRALQEQGTLVFPPPQALALTQDKTVMRSALEKLDVPQPLWAVIDHADENAVSHVGNFPCIAKLPVGGYDGKGVRVVTQWSEIEDWLERGPVLLEELVEFSRELAQLGARRPSGQWQAWSVVETRQQGGVCAQVISPAEGLNPSQASLANSLAEKIADTCGVVGVLAVELFEKPSGDIVVNELAMRPHNSGHIFTEQSDTSQFEQHLRAVTDTALGSTRLRDNTGIMINLFGSAEFSTWQQCAGDFPSVKFHSYQKPSRPGRKAGHLALTGPTTTETLSQALAAEEAYKGAHS